jgi:hypothetical protein
VGTLEGDTLVVQEGDLVVVMVWKGGDSFIRCIGVGCDVGTL